MVRQAELPSIVLPEQDNPVVCRCLHIRQAEIVNAISLCGATSVKEVRQLTGAGVGCTCCHRQINQLINACGTCPLRRNLVAATAE